MSSLAKRLRLLPILVLAVACGAFEKVEITISGAAPLDEYRQDFKDALTKKGIPFEAETLPSGAERITYSEKFLPIVQDLIISPPPRWRSAVHPAFDNKADLKWKLRTLGIPFETTTYDLTEYVVWAKEHSSTVEKVMYILIPESQYGEASLWIEIGAIEKAFQIMHQAANNGDADAQLFLGNEYLRGRHVERNLEKSFDLLYRSATSGNENAYHHVGQAYYYGRGTREDHREAYSWFKKAADADQPFGLWMVAVFHRDGLGGLPVDALTAQEWFKKSRAKGGDYSYMDDAGESNKSLEQTR